jgi:hypothetical protein
MPAGPGSVDDLDDLGVVVFCRAGCVSDVMEEAAGVVVDFG